MNYQEFVRSKVTFAEPSGFEPTSKPHPRCKPHVRDLAEWAIRNGRKTWADYFPKVAGKPLGPISDEEALAALE